MRMRAEMPLGNRNMPMTKPINPSDRSLERTPSKPKTMAAMAQTRTSHVVNMEAITQPPIPDMSPAMLNAVKMGRSCLRHGLLGQCLVWLSLRYFTLC